MFHTPAHKSGTAGQVVTPPVRPLLERIYSNPELRAGHEAAQEQARRAGF